MSDKHKQKQSVMTALGTSLVFVAVTALAYMALISAELAILIGGIALFIALFSSLALQSSRHHKEMKSGIRDLKKAHILLSQRLDKQEKNLKATKKAKKKVEPLLLTDPVDEDVSEIKGTPAPPQTDYMPDLVSTPQMPLALKASAIEAPDLRDPVLDESEGYSDTIVRELLHNAVRQKNVEVFLQPIVRLPQRHTRYYEMYARIRARAGFYIPAARYLDLAKNDNLMGSIDNLALLSCLKSLKPVQDLEKTPPFFLNIESSTLMDRAFMSVLLGFLKKNRALSSKIIFEIGQSDFNGLSKSARQILDGLAGLGCRFSLDHVSDYALDVTELQKRHVVFLKIDKRWFLDAVKSDKTFADVSRFKRQLEGNGIGVIVEKIETEHDLCELLDYDVHYGQGFLFGKPDLQGAYQQRPVKHQTV